MKTKVLITSVFLAGITLLSAAETNPTGFVDFGKLPPPANGRQFVEVNIKSNLISMLARLVEKEEADVSKLLRGLQAVRVNVIGLDDGNRQEIEEKIKTIRADLDARGWDPIVTAQENKQDVRIHLKMQGDQAISGLVVTVVENNKEAILVNIVGNIKPEEIAELGEKFNIDPLRKLGKQIRKNKVAKN